MKKAIVFLSALLALVACNKEITQPESTPKVFNITVNYGDGTKAAKTGWENGDEVYVFFSTVEAPKYLKLSYNGTWTATKYNGATEGDFDITSNGKMTAIYLPYGNSETVSADETSFVFGNSYTSYYLKAEKADYTVVIWVNLCTGIIMACWEFLEIIGMWKLCALNFISIVITCLGSMVNYHPLVDPFHTLTNNGQIT